MAGGFDPSEPAPDCSTRESRSFFHLRMAQHGDRFEPSDFLGLPARERPRRCPQSRGDSPPRRPLERRVPGGREQYQGDDGPAAPLRPAPVRRRPRPPLPHVDRHRLQPERGGRGRHRHRGRVDRPGRGGDQGDGQARGRIRDRAARRPRHDHARLEGGQAVHAEGVHPAPRGTAAQGPLGLDQVRRVGHDLGVCLEPHDRQRLRQDVRPRRHPAASARPPRSPAASTWSPSAAAPRPSAPSS